jgi:hypothetical protein
LGWLDHLADFTAVACLASTLSNSAQASGESSSLGGTNCQKSGKYASHSLKILAPFALPVFSYKSDIQIKRVWGNGLFGTNFSKNALDLQHRPQSSPSAASAQLEHSLSAS